MARSFAIPVPVTGPAVLNSLRFNLGGLGLSAPDPDGCASWRNGDTMAELTDPAGPRRAALMAAAQDGDAAAYSAVLRESVPVIRAAARRRGVAPDAIDDVVQDVLLTIHRVRHTYDPTRSFDAWLHAISDRRAIDLLRRRGRRQAREVHAPDSYLDHADPAASAETRAEINQQTRRIGAALQDLPPGQREAVERLAIRDQSLAEAAAETGRSTGALKVNLHRALKALRARLAGDV